MNIKNNMNVRAPWIKSLGSVPAHLDYFQGTMYDKIAEVSENYPDLSPIEPRLLIKHVAWFGSVLIRNSGTLP